MSSPNSKLKTQFSNKIALISEMRVAWGPWNSGSCLSHDFRVPTILSDVIISRMSQNAGKCYPYNYSFITAKRCKSEQLERERHRAKSERIPNMKFPLSLSQVRTHYLPSTLMCDNAQSVANQGSSPSLWCTEFLLVLSLRHDWLNHWQNSWTPSPG